MHNLLTPGCQPPQPPVVLAHLTRTEKSLAEHGENVRAEWAPDGSRIVIQVRVPCFPLNVVSDEFCRVDRRFIPSASGGGK